jgi:sulfonate transport system ATP-binding protein
MNTTERRYPVQVTNVEKAFRVGDTSITVFPGISFTLYEGSFLTLLGPSGCGKTTLLKMLAGLDLDYSGRITVWGRKPGEYRDSALVFQESRLLPWFSVRTNVRLALSRREGEENPESRVDIAFGQVRLNEEFRNAWPHQLSSGMSKRAALARALVNDPKVLLLDEPFAALDTPVKQQLQEELWEIHKRRKLSTILVTHDVEEAVYLSDRVLVLSPMPSRVRDVFDVGLDRPRFRGRDDFVARCSDLLERLVRASAQPQAARS